MRQRVARSRDLVAEGHALRWWRVSPGSAARRSTEYRDRERLPQRRPPADAVEAAIVAEALANQTDGYRMICAFVRRTLGAAGQPQAGAAGDAGAEADPAAAPLERRKRPGFFRVERPRQLWQLDMTSIWVAEHGWTYLNAIIDCCTREIVGWHWSCAAAPTRRSPSSNGPPPCTGSSRASSCSARDNGSAFTARRFRGRLAELGIKHRRGGYRDPESQAFIESWFGKLKEREVWLNEYETLDDARRGIGGYVDRYHHRPHSRLGLQNTLRGHADLGRSTKTRGLNCQLRWGARQGSAEITLRRDASAGAGWQSPFAGSPPEPPPRQLRRMPVPPDGLRAF